VSALCYQVIYDIAYNIQDKKSYAHMSEFKEVATWNSH